ncbi:MAG: hypothetical protein KDK78_05520, partial [Chlamydiia bacterium]|nr:hypothetical protein [Chlamydiia bacterium]
LKAIPNSTKRNALEQARSALVKLTAESYLEPLSVKGSSPQDLKESVKGLTELLSSPDSHSETLFLVSDNIESNRFIESIREVTEKDSTIDPTGQNLIRALHTSSEGKVVAESLVGKVMDMDMPEQALSNFFRGSEATPRLLFAHLDSILGTDTKALLNTFYADNKARLSVPLEVQVSKANAPENDDQLNERSEELSKLAGSLLDASSTLLETILTQKGEKGKLLRSILSKYATDAQTHFRAKHREPLQGADIQKYQSDGSEFGSTLATNFVFLRCINPLLAQGQFLDNTAQLNPVQSQNLKLVSTVAQKTVNVAPGRDNLQFAAQTLIDGGAARRTLDRMKVLSKVDPNVQTDFQLRN